MNTKKSKANSYLNSKIYSSLFRYKTLLLFHSLQLRSELPSTQCPTFSLHPPSQSHLHPPRTPFSLPTPSHRHHATAPPDSFWGKPQQEAPSMAGFEGVVVSDPWLHNQFTQVELRSLKNQVPLPTPRCFILHSVSKHLILLTKDFVFTSKISSFPWGTMVLA